MLSKILLKQQGNKLFRVELFCTETSVLEGLCSQSIFFVPVFSVHPGASLISTTPPAISVLYQMSNPENRMLLLPISAFEVADESQAASPKTIEKYAMHVIKIFFTVTSPKGLP